MSQPMRRTDRKDLRANRASIRNTPQNREHVAWKRRTTGDLLLLAAALLATATFMAGIPAAMIGLALTPALLLAATGLFILAMGTPESARASQAPARYSHNG